MHHLGRRADVRFGCCSRLSPGGPGHKEVGYERQKHEDKEEPERVDLPSYNEADLIGHGIDADDPQEAEEPSGEDAALPSDPGDNQIADAIKELPHVVVGGRELHQAASHLERRLLLAPPRD